MCCVELASPRQVVAWVTRTRTTHIVGHTVVARCLMRRMKNVSVGYYCCTTGACELHLALTKRGSRDITGASGACCKAGHCLFVTYLSVPYRAVLQQLVICGAYKTSESSMLRRCLK